MFDEFFGKEGFQEKDNCRLMYYTQDGHTGIRYLLLTILATAAAATYEYDVEYVRRVFTVFSFRRNFIFNNIKVINAEAVVDWSVMDAVLHEVHFQITEFTKSSGKRCGGGPAIVFKSVMHCLFKITFHTDTKDGKEIIQYSLIFRNSKNFFHWRLATSNVYAKTADYQENPDESILVEPISKEHLLGARNKTPFQMNTAWLKRIVEGGFYVLNEDMINTLVGNLAVDGDRIVYYTLPLVMDAEIVNEIVYLASLPNEEPTKNEITDVWMYTKAMLAEWEEEMYGKEQ